MFKSITKFWKPKVPRLIKVFLRTSKHLEHLKVPQVVVLIHICTYVCISYMIIRPSTFFKKYLIRVEYVTDRQTSRIVCCFFHVYTLSLLVFVFCSKNLFFRHVKYVEKTNVGMTQNGISLYY